jgi:hypothetical protein
VIAATLDVWQHAPAVRAALINRWRSMLWWCALIAAAFFFVTFVDVLLYYLMITPPRAASVIGVQVRHFFPIAIMSLLLPVLLRSFAPDRADHRGVWQAVAGSVLLVLFLGRTAFLAMDLMVRYW